MVVILLGAPGSGKGTISNFLVNSYGFKHISTGDLFRKTMQEDTPLAKELKERISSGRLVDDELTNQVVKEEIEKLDLTTTNVIFDGYPRNLIQLEYLNNLVKVDYVIDVHVELSELIKRITGRRTCPVCKEIYNIYYKKPKVDNICDHDGATLVQRQDDNEATVQERLKVYSQLNKPLVDYYTNMNVLCSVVNDSIEHVQQQVKEILKLK